MQLQEDLCVEGEAPQTLEEQPFFFAAYQATRWRGAQVFQAVDLRVDLSTSPMGAPVHQQFIAGDPEQKRSEARRAAKAFAAVYTRHQSLLDQVLRVARRGGLEKPVQRHEMALDQRAASGSVAVTPCRKQLRVGRHNAILPRTVDERDAQLLSDEIDVLFARAATDEPNFEHLQALELTKAALLGSLPQAVMIGRYHLLSCVGRGAMGIVYAAWDPQLERRVALKVVAPQGCGPAFAKEQARLLREGQTLARLRHPNVVTVHDVGLHNELVYLVMEYIEGPTLAQWLARGQSRRDALAVLLAAARGLAAAHRAGIVHRDFKPENVLIGVGHGQHAARAPERVLVADFGVAGDNGDTPQGPFESGEGPATVASSGGGTPAYAAPEQLAGQGARAPADQYAFCVVMHEALTGGRPRSAEDLDAGLPRRLRRVLARGMHVDPRGRFADLDGLIASLENNGRQRVLVAVGALGIIASAGLYGRATSQTCAEDPGPIGTVWNDERRQAVAARSASAAPALRADALLDGYAQEWQDARATTCAAPADKERALRLACLADRRDHLDALVEVFTEPDAIADYAATAARALPSIDACTRVGSLGQHETVRATTAEQFAEFSRGLARADALEEAGRYADAAALLASLLGEDNPRSPAQGAAALQLAGVIAIDRHAFAEAHGLLMQAVEAAAAADDARIEFNAWRALAFAAAEDARFDEAEAYAAAAGAALARLGGDDVNLRHHLLYTRAIIAVRKGDYTAAIEFLEQAIALQQSIGADDARQWELWHALANAQRRRALFDNALVSSERAVELVTGRFGPSHPATAQAKMTMAQALDAVGRDAEAVATYQDVIATLELTLGPDHRALAIPLLNFGNLLGRTHRPGTAVAHARYRSIVAREFPPDHDEHGRAQYTLAEEQLDNGDFAAALASATAAVAIARRGFREPHTRVAFALVVQGQALVKLGRPLEATVVQTEALELAARALAPDDADWAEFPLEAADAFAAAGRLGEARALRQRARDHLYRCPLSSAFSRGLLVRAERELASGGP